jgi:predicted enzyme related to lactoylglutathione lyase
MNRVVHFEIHASDVEKMKKFYTDVFGWEMQQMGYGVSAIMSS